MTFPTIPFQPRLLLQTPCSPQVKRPLPDAPHPSAWRVSSPLCHLTALAGQLRSLVISLIAFFVLTHDLLLTGSHTLLLRVLLLD